MASYQEVYRGESKTIRARVVLLTGPVGREFYARCSKIGSAARFNVELTAEVEDDGDVYVEGTMTAEHSALLSDGLADIVIYATNPMAVLHESKLQVKSTIGVNGVL